jgi:hypothetical protein
VQASCHLADIAESGLVDRVEALLRGSAAHLALMNRVDQARPANLTSLSGAERDLAGRLSPSIAGRAVFI